MAHSKKAVDLLREPLVHSSFGNVITNGLQKEIAKRYKEEQSEQVMFAVVGDMKAGMCELEVTGGDLANTLQAKVL